MTTTDTRSRRLDDTTSFNLPIVKWEFVELRLGTARRDGRYFRSFRGLMSPRAAEIAGKLISECVQLVEGVVDCVNVEIVRVGVVGS